MGPIIYDGKYLFNKNKFYFKNLGTRLYSHDCGSLLIVVVYYEYKGEDVERR